jgi:putative chitinase
MSLCLTADQIRRAAPHGHVDIVAAIADQSEAVFAKYALNNENRVLGLMSTVLEETGGLTVLTENDNYDAARAHVVFHEYFPTVESAVPYAHNPQAFCDRVYGGRMGNTGPNDGWLYRGQGLIQITGRDNFSDLEKATGLPLLRTPAIVTSAEHMLECTVALFVQYRGILSYCDEGEFNAVWALVGSGRATGEIINLANHQAALAEARKMLPINAATPGRIAPGPASPAAPTSAPAGVASAPTPVRAAALALKAEIEAFQEAVGLAEIDGVYGPLTRDAYEKALAA